MNRLIANRASFGRRRQGGLSLLEVLITIVILAFGILGVAALITLSTRQAYVASVHTAATLVGESMIDRMSANTAGVWADLYDGTYPSTGTTAVGCAVDSPCTPAQRAQADRVQWESELLGFLPGGTATIACNGPVVAVADPAFNTVNVVRPPYPGVCDLTITWNASATSVETAEASTIAWRFKP